jgi:Tol biopolymer transport system component
MTAREKSVHPFNVTLVPRERVAALPSLGKKVAFDFADGSNRDVWIADIASGQTQRLTYDPEVDHSPVWSADDTRLVFDSHRGGLGDPFVKATNGASSEIRLLPWRATLGAEDWVRRR